MIGTYDLTERVVIESLQESVLTIFRVVKEPWEDEVLWYILGVLAYYMYEEDYSNYREALGNTYPEDYTNKIGN